MKPENVVTVLVAVIAGAASVGGILYNQNGALKLEREKWCQSVASDSLKLEREAVAQFARDFTTSFYLAEKMIWRIEMTFRYLSAADFAEYTKQSDLQKPKLAMSQVVLATVDSARHARVSPLLAELRRIDEQLIMAGPRMKGDRERVSELLNDEVKRFPDFQKLMVDSLSDAAVRATSPASAPDGCW